MRAAPDRRRSTRIAEPSPSDDTVPEGWVLAALPAVVDINPPKPPLASLEPESEVTFIPMPAVDENTGTIARPQVRPFSQARKGHTAFREGDVIMAKITPCMENGKTAIARGLVNGLGFGSTEFHVLRSLGGVLPEYLHHYIRQRSFRRSAEAEMTGSVGQKRVPRVFLEVAEIPTPPLAEQERIVDALDGLIGKLESCRDRIERIPEILSRFRQAVLAAACSGRLTEDWRVHRERKPALASSGKSIEPPDGFASLVLPEGWTWIAAGSAYRDACYGTSTKCDATADGVPVLRVPNIAAGRLELVDMKYASTGDDLTKLIVEPGDIVICRTNGSIDLIGKAAVIPPMARPHAFASYLIRLRLDATILLSDYFHLLLSSPLGRLQLTSRARTTAGQFNLNLAILRGLAVPLPPVDEQREIVRFTSELLRMADLVEQRVVASSARAGRLRQAVLAKAFRGELVPTEAELAAAEGRTYESAEELLQHFARDVRTAAPRNDSVLRTHARATRQRNSDG